MPETPFDPAPMPVAGAFSEPAAIKAHAEMVNQINVLRSDRDTWRRLCREAQAEGKKLQDSAVRHFQEEHLAGDGPEVDRWKAEVKRLEGLILDWEDYTPGAAAHGALLAEARRIRAQREEGR